jgi:hypothetical protein
MSIVRQIIDLSIVVNNTLTFVEVNIPTAVLNQSLCEIIIGVQSNSTPVDNSSETNYKLEWVNNGRVRVVRTTSAYTITLSVCIIEYTASSGVIIDNINVVLNSASQTLIIPSRDRTKRYLRISQLVYPNSANTIRSSQFKADLSSDNQIIFTNNNVANTIDFYGQLVYIPDMAVQHLNFLTSGTVETLSIPSSPRLKTFPIVSYTRRSASPNTITPNLLKRVEIVSDTSIATYSYVTVNTDMNVQLITRANNKVEHFEILNNLSWSVNLVPAGTFDWSKTFHNMAVAFGRFTPADTTLIDYGYFSFLAKREPANNRVVLMRYFSSPMWSLNSQFIELGDLVPIVAKTGYFKLYRRSL